MDDRQGEGGAVPSPGLVHEDRGYNIGSDPCEAHGGAPGIGRQPIQLRRRATRVHPPEHPRENHARGGPFDIRGVKPGEIDAVSIKQWLICYGEASAELRHILASLTECLGKYHPPWVAHQALMTGCLIRMNEHLGVRPVRIRKTWR